MGGGKVSLASQGQKKITSVKEGLRRSGTEGQVQNHLGKTKIKTKTVHCTDYPRHCPVSNQTPASHKSGD